MNRPTGRLDPITAMQVRQLLTQAADLHQSGQAGQAAALCYRIIQMDPDNGHAHHMMSHVALETGALDIALTSLRRAHKLQPRSAPVAADLGRALLANRAPLEAVKMLRAAIKLDGSEASYHISLGEALLDNKRVDAALLAYREALRLAPGNKIALHMVEALEKQTSGKGESDYVSTLFDSYAAHFDQHLKTLHYAVPDKMAELLRNHALPPNAASLDLGCGTGLVAAALSDRERVFDGIDIAPKMIEQARERGLYRNLRAGDILDVIETDPQFRGPYGLVTAGDVFIYIGKLDAIFSTVRDLLDAEGLFVFSVERSDDADVAVRSSGRFAQSVSYIEKLSKNFGFEELERHELPVRTEAGAQIPGLIFVLRKTA